MPLTPEEKTQLAADFRAAATSINDMGAIMAENEMTANVDVGIDQGGSFRVQWGVADFPATISVASIIGCDQF